MELNILKQLLALSGLSQKKVSEKINIPETRISEWLRGVRNPKLSTILGIANKLGFDISFNIKKSK